MSASTPISAEAPEAVPAPIHPKLTSVRRAAVVPAFNEAETIAGVIEEIRAVDPGMEIIVVDDASFDRTPVIAAEAGARVLRLACNLGIGGAVQTGYQAAREIGCDIVVQIDGDGQHDPKELPLDSRAGARRASGHRRSALALRGAGKYRAPPVRRLGMRIFATFVSLLVGKSLSDTSSSFRAVNRRALSLFAVDYPHGYLETIEATVMAVRYGLRIEEVPVRMRERTSGRSSLTTSISLFYTVKVVIAVFISMFRRKAVQLEEER